MAFKRCGAGVVGLFADYDLSVAIPDTVAVSRSGTATRVNSLGKIEPVNPDTARVNYNPATLAALGVLVEGSRTNLIPSNAQITAAAGWTLNACTTTEAAATGPDGNASMWKLAETAVAATHYTWMVVAKAAASLPYAATCYFKPAERNVITLTISNDVGWSNSASASFDGSALTVLSQTFGTGFAVVSTSITDVGGGIRRAELRATTDASTNLFLSIAVNTAHQTNFYTGTAGSGAYIWRPQLEQTSGFAGSVIYTSGTAVTRNADLVTSNTSQIAGYGQGSGSRVVWCRTGSLTTQTAQTLYQEDDETTDNRVSITRNTSQEVHVLFVSGGVTQADLNLGTVAANSLAQVALSWQDNSFKAKLKGGPTTITDTSGTAPTGLTTIRYGMGASGGLEGHISVVRAWNTVQPDSELFDDAVQQPTPLAFPGAVGFGRNSLGGRGGQVIHVTNLNASGPGSFKAACDTVGPRTIVFDVGGVITFPETAGYLVISNSHITIAGETAPSPGIHIAGRGIKIATNNVVMRHITVRLHDTAGMTGPADQYVSGDVPVWVTNTFPSIPVRDIIIDHCTMHFGTYLAAAIGPTSTGPIIENVTFSNNAYIEPLSGNGLGLFLATACKNVTMYRNVLAYGTDRMPFLNPVNTGETITMEYLNNIAFNGTYGHEYMAVGPLQANAFNDTLKPIIISVINNRYPSIVNDSPMIWFLTAVQNRNSQVYHSGNTGGVKTVIFQNENTYNPIVASPPILSGIGTTHGPALLTASAAMETDVLSNVGARPNNRDTATTRAINRIISKTGSSTPGTVAGYGGQPTISSTSSTYSAPSNPTGDDDNDGYTNIEEDLANRAAALLN